MIPAHKVAVLASTAGKANGVLSEMYADSDEAGETGNHPARTHDGPACEIRTRAHAGCAEQAPRQMNESNAEPVRSTVTMHTSAIPGHTTNITFARLLLRPAAEQPLRKTRAAQRRSFSLMSA